MQFQGTTAALNGAQSFVGTWLNTNTGDAITGSVFADQAGTLYVEQSSDGVNADVSANYTVTASTPQGFNETVLCPFYRLRYVNGATNQGTFRLFSRVASSGVKP